MQDFTRRFQLALIFVQLACAGESVAQSRPGRERPSRPRPAVVTPPVEVTSREQVALPEVTKSEALQLEAVTPSEQVTSPAPVTEPVPPVEPGAASGSCVIPPEARLEDTSQPDRIVGTGTAASCSAQAFIDAVALGGKIGFDCGPSPVVITLDRPAKIFNDASDEVVIDGGNLVTLSGGDATRILYMNTCDPEQHWTTSQCDNQATPRLTVQNLTFAHGNSSSDTEYAGGGAIFARGGRLKVINSHFVNNTCIDTGPDVAGAAIRAFSQYQDLPVYVVGSTFGGAEGLGNVCSNGGAIGSIEVNWSIIDSVFSHNQAIGFGGNPAAAGTPGGGSGGAIYNDGQEMTLSLCGTLIEHNQVRAFGSGIFFVSNNHQGTVRVEHSVISGNRGGGWNVQPGVSMHEDTTWIELDSIVR